jgi:hypothetical protein
MSKPHQFEIVKVRRLKFSSLFAMFFFGFLVFFGPFILFCGIAAIFGAHTIEVSGRYVTGVLGFIQALIMIPLVTAGTALIFSTMCYLGIRIAGRFCPLVLAYLPAKKEPNQSLQTTTMAVTDAAAQPPRQP